MLSQKLGFYSTNKIKAILCTAMVFALIFAMMDFGDAFAKSRSTRSTYRPAARTKMVKTRKTVSKPKPSKTVTVTKKKKTKTTSLIDIEDDGDINIFGAEVYDPEDARDDDVKVNVSNEEHSVSTGYAGAIITLMLIFLIIIAAIICYYYVYTRHKKGEKCRRPTDFYANRPSPRYMPPISGQRRTTHHHHREDALDENDNDDDVLDMLLDDENYSGRNNGDPDHNTFDNPTPEHEEDIFSKDVSPEEVESPIVNDGRGTDPYTSDSDGGCDCSPTDCSDD